MKKYILASLLALSMAGGAAAQSLQVGSNGNVGVGTSTPSEKLEVAGNLKVNSAVLAPAGAAPMFTVRTWVNFNGSGTNGTDQTIRANGNVSRVYKTSTGTYTVYFTTPMQDANYCVIATSGDVAGGNGRVVNVISATTTEIQILIRGTGGSGQNSDLVMLAVVR